ncbi:MAG TPA: type I methionyl aminopeptidase [Methylomirabilota bacterium]|nr:type I methionyl aminopeptidase [Methylomirabilota bacterium]
MIVLKSPREIDLMRRGGLVLADLMDRLRAFVKPGMSTLEIDEEVETFITGRDARPAFKGYRGFPATVCVSINDEVVHGIPSAHRRLKEGDIVGLDLGCIIEGYYADCAFTMALGEIGLEVQKLLDVTRESLEFAIQECRPGRRLGDVSHAVQRHVEANRLAVVRAFVGHGIGRALHEEPQVPNFGEPGRGPVLKTGMVLAIEPMVTMGSCEVRILDDGWTAITKDGSLAAHFEHTIAVTPEGPDVLTRRVAATSKGANVTAASEASPRTGAAGGAGARTPKTAH